MRGQAKRCIGTSPGRKLKEKLNGGLPEAVEFLGQLSLRIEQPRIIDACVVLK